MANKLEEIGKNKVKVTVEISADEFDKALDFSYNKNKKNFKINGFRPGTAPRVMVENTYGEQILYEDAVDHILEVSYERDVIKENNLEPVTMPDIDIVQIGKGKELIYTAVVTTRPEVELGEYKGVTIDKIDTSVSDEEVLERIKADAEKNARIKTVEGRKSKLGDILNINFVGSIDGKEFEGGTADNYEIELGSKTFIDTFEDQLVGYSAGDEVDVNVKFPEDYNPADFAGKPALFKTVINSVSEKIVPEIDDELAKDVSEFDTLSEYKADIKEKLKEEKEHNAKHTKQEKMLEIISGNAKLEIPDTMIEAQVNNSFNRLKRNLSAQGMDLNQFIQYTGQSTEKMKESFRVEAEREIRLALILDAISKKENIEVSEEDVKKELEKIAERTGRTYDDVDAMIGQNKIELIEELKIQRTIEMLEENVKEK